MKKLLLAAVALVVSLSVNSAQAVPSNDYVVSCTDKTGKFPHQTMHSVVITQNPDSDKVGYTLEVQRCTGVLNWGCGNGMEDLINEIYDVKSTSSQDDFLGNDVSFDRTPDGGYRLKSPVLNHQFSAADCRLSS